jgi:hypothetical protein
MAIANHFYNETTRKYVAVFGTVFNQIKITRAKTDGTVVQDLIVPLSYGPAQKFLARLEQDPNINRKSAISLPRMSFEMTSLNYDPERKIGQTQKIMRTNAEETGQRGFTYVGAPYNLEFTLSIMTKYTEDAAKIMEQIIPFFQPDFTQTVKLIPDIDPLDIPIILNSVTTEEIYEGDFIERRSVMYTLSFTMKGWYFGPQRKAKIIKFIDTNFYDGVETNAPFLEGVDIRPGLDSNGNPVRGQGGVTATARATVANGLVTAVTVVNNGEGYSSNNTVQVTIAPPSVVNATATAVTSNTTISSISITEGGGYYTSVPSVSITAPNASFVNATATATTNANNEVTGLTVVNAGTFYDSANVSISAPAAKSSVIKFGDDALWHNDYSDVFNIGPISGNIQTGTNQGYVIQFWIYPTIFPSSYSLRIVSFDGNNMRIEYNATSGQLQYYPPFGGAQTSRTENLVLNQWNHVRFEHVGSAQRWIVNGVNAGGGFVGQGTLVTSGTDVIIGDYIDTSNNAANGDRSFLGYFDDFSIDTLTALSSANVAIPNTAISGSFITETFDKQNAIATANVQNGEIVSIDVTDAGANYTSIPTVTITTPNGQRSDYQATATASLTDGVVTGITVTDAGKFYDSASVTIDAPVSNTATASVTVDSHGDVTAVTVDNPGKGYRSAPLVTIAEPGGSSIPYTQIEFDDNWGVITTIVEEE